MSFEKKTRLGLSDGPDMHLIVRRDITSKRYGQALLENSGRFAEIVNPLLALFD
jgi:hypothetical protein